jgi:hypothetical protein
MGYSINRIEYETEGSYGSTDKGYLYRVYYRGTDAMVIYDKDGHVLFESDEWSDKCKYKQLIKLLESGGPLEQGVIVDDIETISKERFEQETGKKLW